MHIQMYNIFGDKDQDERVSVGRTNTLSGL